MQKRTPTGTASARLRDWDERAKGAVSRLRLPAHLGKAVLVHPLADDRTLLEKLRWRASRCVVADAYWRFGDDVFFVQVRAVDPESGESSGVFGRAAVHETDSWVANYVAVVDEKRLTRAVFRRVLTSLVEIVSRSSSALGPQLRRLDARGIPRARQLARRAR